MDLERMRQKMANHKATESEADNSKPGEEKKDGPPDLDQAVNSDSERAEQKGQKSGEEKVKAAEEVTRRAKERDPEDSREETSGTERHDLVIPNEVNIPPTIVSERLRLGQNPATGEPWSREERMEYDKLQEQGRQKHQQAVRESERRMKDEQAKENQMASDQRNDGIDEDIEQEELDKALAEGDEDDRDPDEIQEELDEALKKK